MNRLIFSVVVFALLATGRAPATNLSERTHKSIQGEAGGLQLSLMSHKGIYHRGDEFRMQVMLRNSSDKDIYVFGTLDWGYSASLIFLIRDARGNEVVPDHVPDTPPIAPPVERSAYVKLRPDHFLGTSYFAPLRLMSLTKPGKYSIVAKYRCPFARADVPVSPFWAAEDGVVESNVVYVTVR